MHILHVTVANKKATYRRRDGGIVCGNDDYKIQFTFDEEWAGLNEKTARFVWGTGQFTDVPFAGDTCDVPRLEKIDQVKVGVFAGNLETTTSATIDCFRSILCEDGLPSVQNDGYWANQARASADRAAAAAASATEESREEVTRLVGELGIVQEMGNSPTAVMSQEATTKAIREAVKDSGLVLKKTVRGDRFLILDNVSSVSHGVTVAAECKNLIPYPYIDTTKTENGVTFTDNGDGSITVNGTATKVTVFHLCSGYFGENTLKAWYPSDGSYVISGYTDDSQYGIDVIYDNFAPGCYIRMGAGISADNIKICPQLERGRVATEYHPPNASVTVRTCGKNLIQYPYIDTTKTENGITFTNNGDGGITVNGTATGAALFLLCSADFGDVTLMAWYPKVNGYVISGYTDDSSYGVDVIYDAGGKCCYLRVGAGVKVDGVTVYPQMERGSAATSYERYKEGQSASLVGGGEASFNSIDPVMVIRSDSSHFNLSAGYNFDTDELFDLVEDENPSSLPAGLPAGLPVLYFTGDTNGMSKDNAVPLSYTYGTRRGGCTLKWQGSSSLSYPKKNYTVKFDEAFEAKTGWGAQKKYCLKANYIDFSHARNVVSATLWGQIVASRGEGRPMYGLPNGGAIDGFPVLVVLNNVYQGLYTFNIPKDGWMFGMGGSATEAIVCADDHVAATQFRAPATCDGDFEIEYAPDENNTQWVVNSLNNAIRATIGATGTDFLTTVGAYVDIDSAVDYYIFTCLIAGGDMTDKNYILFTFDGVKWYFSAYDLDSVFGNWWDGKSYAATTAGPTFESYGALHKLMNLIHSYAPETLKARYAELRESVLSEDNVLYVFSNFLAKIPKAVKDEEVRIWTEIPGTDTNNLTQIMEFYRLRCKALDREIENL